MSEAGSQPPRRSVMPAGSPVDIRPLESTSDKPTATIPQDWLPRDDTPEARYLARLEADEDLVLHLALQGFKGSDFDFFNGKLAKYGIGVLSGWMVSGLIFAKVKERGFGGLPAPPGDELRDRDTIEELVGETVAKALVHSGKTC